MDENRENKYHDRWVGQFSRVTDVVRPPKSHLTNETTDLTSDTVPPFFSVETASNSVVSRLALVRSPLDLRTRVLIPVPLVGTR